MGFHTLENGITVVVEQIEQSEEIHCSLGALTGMEEVKILELGISHILEHWGFRGSSLRKTLKRNRKLEERLIASNGSTDHCSFHIYFRGPPEHEEKVVRKTRAWLTTPIDPGQLEVEKMILLEEIEEIVDDKRIFEIETVLRSHLYPNSGFGLSYEASLDTIPLLTPATLEKYRAHTLRPDNLMVVLTGDKPEKKLLALAQKYFANIPPRPVIEAQSPHTPVQEGRFRVECEREGIRKCHVNHVLRTQEITAESLALITILDSILTGRDTSLFYENIRLMEGRTYLPHTQVRVLRPELMLDITYTCKPAVLERNVAYVEETIEQLGSKKRSEEFFKTFRRVAIRDLRSHLTNEEALGDWYINNYAAGIAITPKELVARMKDVTRRELRDFVETLLPDMGVAIMHPNYRRTGPMLRVLSSEEAMQERVARENSRYV